jgi:16S rRNA (cytidine1402-2'-O)-methyltransferase
MPGTLFVVATPIGNLEDITLRALRVLRTVSLVAAEDTRHTRTLLQHYDIPTPLTSLHEHNERRKGQELVARLLAGESIALVSDAGTPLVADPGFLLVRDAIAANVRVEAVPGPSAAVAALSVSGLPAESFLFLSFAPSRSAARRRWLEGLKAERRTIVFFETPHRIADTLADLADVLGNRWVVVARELTKVHESLYRGWVRDLVKNDIPERGEFVVLVSDQESAPIGPVDSASNVADELTVTQMFGLLTNTNALSRRDAVARIARERHMSRQDVYRAIQAMDE